MAGIEPLSDQWALDELVALLLRVDAHGVVAEAGGRGLEWIGRSADELVGIGIDEIVVGGVEGRAPAINSAEPVEGLDIAGPVGVELRHADGRTIACDWWTTATEGQAVYAFTPYSDQDGLLDVVADSDTLNAGEIADRVCRALAAPPTHSDCAVLRVVDGSYEVIGKYGMPSALVDGTIIEPAFLEAISGDGPRLVNDFSQVGVWGDLVEAAGYRSVLIFPHTSGDMRIALVSFRPLAEFNFDAPSFHPYALRLVELALRGRIGTGV